MGHWQEIRRCNCVSGVHGAPKKWGSDVIYRGRFSAAQAYGQGVSLRPAITTPENGFGRMPMTIAMHCQKALSRAVKKLKAVESS